MSPSTWASLFIVAALFSCAHCADFVYYLPSSVNETARGVATFDFPLGVSFSEGGRSQFSYSSTVIDPTLDGKYITAVAFRRAYGWTPTSYSLSRVTVRFGHVRSDPTGGYFLGNFNGSINVVYDGPYTYNGAGCDTFCPFDAVFSFPKPFLYRHYPGGLTIDVSASVAPSRISWEFTSDTTPGCTFTYSTNGITTISSGIWLNRAAQMKVFATDTLPPAAASPVAPPAVPESVFLLPKNVNELTVANGVSYGLPFNQFFSDKSGRSVTCFPHSQIDPALNGRNIKRIAYRRKAGSAAISQTTNVSFKIGYCSNAFGNDTSGNTWVLDPVESNYVGVGPVTEATFLDWNYSVDSCDIDGVAVVCPFDQVFTLPIPHFYNSSIGAGLAIDVNATMGNWEVDWEADDFPQIAAFQGTAEPSLFGNRPFVKLFVDPPPPAPVAPPVAPTPVAPAPVAPVPMAAPIAAPVAEAPVSAPLASAPAQPPVGVPAAAAPVSAPTQSGSTAPKAAVLSPTKASSAVSNSLAGGAFAGIVTACVLGVAMFAVIL